MLVKIDHRQVFEHRIGAQIRSNQGGQEGMSSQIFAEISIHGKVVTMAVAGDYITQCPLNRAAPPPIHTVAAPSLYLATSPVRYHRGDGPVKRGVSRNRAVVSAVVS